MAKKEETIKKFQKHEKDTGSAEVQIGVLSQNIKKMLEHLKIHPKDNHSRRGLLKMVIKRKRLLKFLEKSNRSKYLEVAKAAGLKIREKKTEEEQEEKKKRIK